MQNIRYSSHRRGPPRKAAKVFFPSFFFIVFRHWSIPFNHQFPSLQILSFSQVIYLLFLIREFGGLWFWVGAVCPGKGGTMRTLGWQCPGRLGSLLIRLRDCISLEGGTKYIELFLMQQIPNPTSSFNKLLYMDTWSEKALLFLNSCLFSINYNEDFLL